VLIVLIGNRGADSREHRPRAGMNLVEALVERIRGAKERHKFIDFVSVAATPFWILHKRVRDECAWMIQNGCICIPKHLIHTVRHKKSLLRSGIKVHAVVVTVIAIAVSVATHEFDRHEGEECIDVE